MLRTYPENIIAEVEPRIKGDIKWDGCANIDYCGIAHYCEPMQLIQQSEVLKWVYKKAKEELPNNQIEEWPSL